MPTTTVFVMRDPATKTAMAGRAALTSPTMPSLRVNSRSRASAHAQASAATDWQTQATRAIAQVPDMDVDRTVEGGERRALDRVDQLFAREDPAVR